MLLEPQGQAIGTVNEDFAVESLAGDVFQLGNTAYRIIRIETGRVRVEDAKGAAPNIPFWLGEAPGRSDELSFGVARLRAEIDLRLAPTLPTACDSLPPEGASSALGRPGGGGGTLQLASAIDWLVDEVGIDLDAASQIVDYLARARAALGALPTQETLVMERFFDESGGMQLVIHTPFGSRINRAWGLALRKRFCRSFNFELQAAASEDALVLSLSTSHSFVLDEVWRYLKSATAEHLLVQALLDAPLFNVRWRWNATTALALPRFAGGRKVAPQLQRMKSDDLLASVFPDQAACLENVVGERELPDHPLVTQTLADCLHEAMDSDGWLALLRRIEAGEVRLIARDLPAPSPLAMEILNARPYAFLDDAPLEERRAQAVVGRRWSDPSSSDDLGALDADAIASVAEEAWPRARNADEVQEALMTLACVTQAEAEAQEGWAGWLAHLAQGGRATQMTTASGAVLWVALERLACMQAAYPGAACAPPLPIPPKLQESWTSDDAVLEMLRARLGGFGPQTVAAISKPLALAEGAIASALARLEAEGFVLRGRFTPGAAEEEWCERHLLARIHRYTLKRLRREIEPVERQDFMRFLFDWQHLAPEARLQGQDAVPEIVSQLEGFEAAAGAWESELLPARIKDYAPPWLDNLCRAGKLVWTRLGAPPRAAGGPVRTTPIVLLPRRELGRWTALPQGDAEAEISGRAQLVHAALLQGGAKFFDELLSDARLLPTELEDALGELVSTGLVNADSFAGLRALLLPAAKRGSQASSRRRRAGAAPSPMEEAGRWALLRRAELARTEAAPTRRPRTDPEALEHVALVLLRRYGVVFWRLLEREAAWLPAWRELLPVYHRLEARGEVRGGRFVAGLAGEQFALPEAIALLREVRRRPLDGGLVAISGVDALNLCGTLLPGDKVPALSGNRIVFQDGLPLATMVAGEVAYLRELAPALKESVRLMLLGRTAPTSLMARAPLTAALALQMQV